MTEPEALPAESQKLSWPRWLISEHTGIVLTLGYLVLIAIGMLHEAFVYLWFKLNILEFADPSDFVLAPLRDPLVMVATIVPMVLAWFYIRGATAVSKRLPKNRLTMLKVSNRTTAGAWSLMTLLWVVAFSLRYSQYKAKQIKAGDASHVSVQYVADPTAGDTSATYLIGATGRAVFLYRPSLKRAEVVPLSNVSRLTVLPQTPKSQP